MAAEAGEINGAKHSVLATLAKIMEQYLDAQTGGLIMQDGESVIVATIPEDAVKTMALTPSGGLLMSVGDVGEQNQLLDQLRASLDRVRELQEEPTGDA